MPQPLCQFPYLASKQEFRSFRVPLHTTAETWNGEPTIRRRHHHNCWKRYGIPRSENSTSCIVMLFGHHLLGEGKASPVHGKNTEAAYELRTEAPDATLGKLYAKECQRPRTAVPREIDPPAVRHCGPHPWMQAGLQLRIKYCY